MLSLFLTGCQTQQLPPSETTLPTGQTEMTDPTEQIRTPLLETAEQVGASEGLLYVPNAHVESFALPQLYLFGNALLLTEHRPGANGGTREFQLISLEDGSLKAQASLKAGSAAAIQIGNGRLAVCDSDQGQVTILDEKLSVVKTHTLPYVDGRWYIDQELSTVYVCLSDRGLLSWDLETGKESWILSQGTEFAVRGTGSGYLIFEYTDKSDLRTYTRSLNMATGAMETIPVKGAINIAYRSNNVWLIRQGGIDGTYTLVSGESAGTFTWPESVVRLIPGRNHLLLSDGSYRTLSLYNTKGNFVSRCTLSDEKYATVGTDFVWSGYWGGYFFVDTWENTGHLMFWDVQKNTEGTNLEITPVGTTEPVDPVLPPELYKQAAELSERFGVNICVAEQCLLEYSHYEAFVLADPKYVREALAVVERSLSKYPEGMLKQLPYGTIEEIRIELVGGLRGKDGMDSHPVSVNGFAQAEGNTYMIVLDSFVLYEETIYHELSHIIDKRLEWHATIYTDASFSEEAWLALQPEGFRYAYAYDNMPDDILAYSNSGYFLREYSMTYPTEDRATLMAAAMMESERFETSAILQEKMRFYAQCIRESFNTDGWPEITPWERA